VYNLRYQRKLYCCHLCSLAVYYDVSAHDLRISKKVVLVTRRLDLSSACRVYQVLPSVM
jgi:hypothetical protein